MVKALELVMEQVRKLPVDRQEYLAGVLGEYVAENDGVYCLSDEERALVDEGIADLDAGRVVSDADMTAFWNRHQP